jgi:hypothetical protein
MWLQVHEALEKSENMETMKMLVVARGQQVGRAE